MGRPLVEYAMGFFARAMIAVLSLAASAARICDQGSGFDPNLKLIVNGMQASPSGKSPRELLGKVAVTELCRKMEVSGVFRCDSVWSFGMSGFAMSDRSVTAEARAMLGDDVASNIIFELSNDIYYQNGVGLRSPPKDPPPKCSRTLRQLSAVTPVYGDPSPPMYGAPTAPTYMADCIKSQIGATDTLSFMSAYKGAPDCHPNCQEPGEFRYAPTGKGVTVYIVDQAVANHTDLGDAIIDRYFSPLAMENAGQPCASWHGTHVAGLVAGTLYGTAKDASIVSVAVQPGCSGDGRTSDLVAGLDWILARHERVGGPSIVSMSLIVTSSAAGSVITDIVKDLLAAGVVVVAAAGNFADDACNYMPANLPGVVTVAAVQLDTLRGVSYASPWASSNIGSCVTLWAPGAYVQSASSDGPDATAIWSGTSQATPYVSGLAAQFLERHPKAPPSVVLQHLLNSSVMAMTRVPISTTPLVSQVSFAA